MHIHNFTDDVEPQLSCRRDWNHHHHDGHQLQLDGDEQRGVAHDYQWGEWERQRHSEL